MLVGREKGVGGYVDGMGRSEPSGRAWRVIIAGLCGMRSSFAAILTLDVFVWNPREAD